jgi:hypothetical protein
MSGKSAASHPFQNHDKFELNLETLNFNPFTLARKALHAPRDRFHKYRILQGDIFCNSRMFKFKMVNSPYCSFCPNIIESIKHLLWECPRSARAWDFVKSETRNFLGNNYITYESVVLGNPNPNLAMETIINWVTRLIMVKNREELISNELISSKIKTLFFFEKQMLGIGSKKMRKRWGPLLSKFQNLA